MAGEVRQPIDQESLENYIKNNVPDLKPPLSLKQVCSIDVVRSNQTVTDIKVSSASDNPIQPTN